MRHLPNIRFRRLSDGLVSEANGRIAQTILALLAAGSVGLTALEANSWAFRLAHYVFMAKRLGLDITMTLENHNGGMHGRYRLVTPIQVLEHEEDA